MRRLAIQDADVAGVVFRIPEGMYSRLYLVLEGTSDTGDTISIAELGNVTATLNGRTFIGNVLAGSLMHFGNLMAGRVDAYLATAGATKAVIPIFCYEPIAGLNNNVLHVTDQDNAVIEINWAGNFVTDLASGYLSLYADDCDGVMNYCYEYNEYSYSLAAAGTIQERIPGENFTHLMIREPDFTNFQLIEIMVDGALKHQSTAYAATGGSNFRNQIEDVGDVDASTLGAQQVGGDTNEPTYTDVAEFPIYNGQWSEALSDNVNLIINASGAVSPTILMTSLNFYPDRAARSKALLQAKIQSALQRKRLLSKTRPVSTFQAQMQDLKKPTPLAL